MTAAVEHALGVGNHSSLPSVAFPAVTPEMELITACARRTLTEAHADQLRYVLARGVDWKRTLELSSWHRLTPLLHWHLSRVAADLVQDRAMGQIRMDSLRTAGRALRMSGELLRLLNAMREEGIVAVPYKGPALAALLYDNIGFRASVDIDVVVRPNDYWAARKVMLSLGYEPLEHVAAAAQPWLLRNAYHESFRKPAGFAVELHWAFASRDIAVQIDVDELFTRLDSVSIGGAKVPSFALEDLLLILCVHGAKHRWGHLEQLVGIAELLRQSEATLDVNRLLARAKQSRSSRMLLLGVLLANKILEASAPDHLVQRARRDRGVVALADELGQLLCSGAMIVNDEEGRVLARDLFHLRIRESARDRLRMVLHRLSTPSQPERWVAASVGGYAIPLHSILRPLRVVIRLGPALVRYYRRKWRG